MMTIEEVQKRSKKIEAYQEALRNYNLMIRIHGISLTFNGDPGKDVSFFKGLGDRLKYAAKEFMFGEIDRIGADLISMNVSVDVKRDKELATRLPKL